MGNIEILKFSSDLLRKIHSVSTKLREPAPSEVYCPISSLLYLLDKVTLEAKQKIELLNVVDSAML